MRKFMKNLVSCKFSHMFELYYTSGQDTFKKFKKMQINTGFFFCQQNWIIICWQKQQDKTGWQKSLLDAILFFVFFQPSLNC